MITIVTEGGGEQMRDFLDILEMASVVALGSMAVMYILNYNLF